MTVIVSDAAVLFSVSAVVEALHIFSYHSHILIFISETYRNFLSMARLMISVPIECTGGARGVRRLVTRYVHVIRCYFAISLSRYEKYSRLQVCYYIVKY